MYEANHALPVPRYDAGEQTPQGSVPLIEAPPMPSAEEDARSYAEVAWNLVSDTVTLPTAAMRTSMAHAVCGDDGYHTDGPTNRLEELLARVTGKEAALFCPSGTQANQLALMGHMRTSHVPASVLCDARAHVHTCEMGGIAFHARASTAAVMPRNGHHLTREDVEAHTHSAPLPVRVISLENTLQGMIFPLHEVQRISEFAREHGIGMHLDGARLWNAAVESEASVADLCRPFDTVSLCLSKGVGAPVGTVLVGDRASITAARVHRKLLGGTMRQTGVLAAAAHMALHENLPRLKSTHTLARRIAARLQDRGVTIKVPVETNMVLFDVSTSGIDADTFLRRAAALDPPIRVRPGRLVVHHATHPDMPERLASLFTT